MSVAGFGIYVHSARALEYEPERRRGQDEVLGNFRVFLPRLRSILRNVQGNAREFQEF